VVAEAVDGKPEAAVLAEAADEVPEAVDGKPEAAVLAEAADEEPAAMVAEAVDEEPEATEGQAAITEEGKVSVNRKRKIPQQEKFTDKLRSRRKKTDKTPTSASKKSVREEAQSVEGTKLDNDNSYLHQFLPDQRGYPRLANILLSPYCNSESPFSGKIAVYLDEANKYPLCYSDFIRYKKEEHISDAVVNAYFWLLGQTYDHVFFASSYLYKLFTLPYNENEELRRVIQKVWPVSLDIMFMPINVNESHWILAVVNKFTKIVDVYDSMKYKNTKEIKLLCKKLDVGFDNNNAWTINDHCKDNIQRQHDFHSCAFFTCWYAYQLALGKSVECWATNISWKKRVKVMSTNIYVSLVNKEIMKLYEED
jgi:Ulp1 family protease